MQDDYTQKLIALLARVEAMSDDELSIVTWILRETDERIALARGADTIIAEEE